MTPTLHLAIADWISMIQRSKSRTTWKTYSSAASVFKQSVRRNKPLTGVTESDYETFIKDLKRVSPRSEKLYATIIALFFEYLSAKNLCKINMDAIRYTRRNETRKVGKRLRKMDMPALTLIAERVKSIRPGKDVSLARAKALVQFLAGSGLRASEAIGLKTSSLNARKMQGVVIGKGDKEATFIIDGEMLVALKQYHTLRKERSEWLFVSHSRRNAKEVQHIEYDTARRDISKIAKIILTDDPEFPITPHQFRHLFITNVWHETGDIKLAQQLARHDNIATTEGYVHADEEDVSKVAGKLKRRSKSNG